ncbi:MAG: recombinase RecX, partial [Nonlabens ulvanivorans]
TLSRKRYEQLHNEKDKYRKRKKLADYLLYRGWEGDLVYDKVKELIS